MPMPSGMAVKIRAIAKVVRRALALCTISAAISLGAVTAVFFLPVAIPVRITLFVPGVLFFSRKVYMFVFARQAAEGLDFEEQFLVLGTDAARLKESLHTESRMWSRSAVVRSIRAADYRPDVDRAPAGVLTRRLERHLREAFSGSKLPRPGFDHFLLALWIAGWAYFAVLHPAPNVLAASMLVVGGLILFIVLGWIEFGLALAVREQRHRLHTFFWDLAEWLCDRFAELRELETRALPYRRTEHFRDQPWFRDSGPENAKAGGLD